MTNNIELNKEIYIENFQIAKRAFLLNSSLEASACAAAFIGSKEPTSEEAMKNAKKILNKSTSIVSTLGRGNCRQVVTATLAKSGDPEAAMEKIKAIHKALDKKFFNSDYLVLAATVIYENCKEKDYDRVIRRTREIYKLIGKDHPLLTGREDIVNCVLMAITDTDPRILAARCENNFVELKKHFMGGNRRQYMACILSIFDDDAEQTAAKTRLTYDLLKKEGVRFDSDAYSAVAAITMLIRDEDKTDIIKAIRKMSDELKSVRGLGALGTGKRIRNLIATALIMDAYTAGSDKTVAKATINTIITAIIVAEMAAIAAASAAASSSSSPH